MLVLSRKQGESIVIDDSVEVTVVAIHEEEVSLRLSGSVGSDGGDTMCKRCDETITIRENIVVTVVCIRRRRDKCIVRLGIEAPLEIPVHRREVYEALKSGAPLRDPRKRRF